MRLCVVLILSLSLVLVPVVGYADGLVDDAVLPEAVVEDVPSDGSSSSGDPVFDPDVVSPEASSSSDPLAGDMGDGSSGSDAGSSVPSEPVIVDSLTVTANQVILAEEVEPRALPVTPIAGGYFIDCSTSALGDCRIYVPYEYQKGSFSFAGSDVISLRASTVTGILYAGSSSYTVRWTSFNTPEYRSPSGSSWEYRSLGIERVMDTNVQIARSDDDLLLFPDTGLLLLILVAGLGVLVVCKFMTL